MSEHPIPIQEDTLLALAPGVDVTQLGLSAQEGFLLSRIHDEVALRDIYALSPFDRTTSAAIIKRLLDLGALAPRAAAPAEVEKSRPVITSRRDYGGFIFAPAEIAETEEIPLEVRREALFLYHKVDELTYYEFLNVPPHAAPADIRKAYRDASRLFHPDAYFGRDIGEFKERITRVFKRLTDAMMTLTNEDRRNRYNEELVKRGLLTMQAFQSLRDKVEADRVAEEAEAEARRKADRLKRNPMMARINKAREHFERGVKEEQAGNVVAAYNEFLMAKSLDPKNPSYERRAKTLERAVDEQKAARYYEQATAAESFGDESFLALYKRAADAAPHNPAYVVSYAEHMISYGEVGEAIHYLNRLTKMNPKSAPAWFLLGNCYLSTKKKDDAVRCYEETLKLDENHKQAKEMMKKAKQWFSF